MMIITEFMEGGSLDTFLKVWYAHLLSLFSSFFFTMM